MFGMTVCFKNVAKRVEDGDILHFLKVILKASGKKGVPQGGVISPLLSNIYLNEVDKMLEAAKEVTRNGEHTQIEYARFADDLVVLIDAHQRHDWLIGAVEKRLREEFAKLQCGACGRGEDVFPGTRDASGSRPAPLRGSATCSWLGAAQARWEKSSRITRVSLPAPVPGSTAPKRQGAHSA
jgi:hypothetical protein